MVRMHTFDAASFEATGEPIFCIGHSHLSAVSQAALATGTAIKGINFWDIPGAVEGDGAQLRFISWIEEAILAQNGPVFSFVGGSVHNVMGLVAHPRPFDFVLPWATDLPIDKNAEYLPYQIARKLTEDLSAQYLFQMMRIRKLCRGEMIHISPPPPSANQIRLSKDIPWNMYPEMTDQVASACLRMKLWLLQANIVSNWCIENSVTYVPSPDVAADGNGYLIEEYYRDGAHANAAYGELVLRQMRRHG